MFKDQNLKDNSKEQPYAHSNVVKIKTNHSLMKVSLMFLLEISANSCHPTSRHIFSILAKEISCVPRGVMRGINMAADGCLVLF